MRGVSGLSLQLATLPTIQGQIKDELTRTALEQRVARERARQDAQRESLAAAATRACRIADCGCEEPGDYLQRPLESAHRCPNPHWLD